MCTEQVDNISDSEYTPSEIMFTRKRLCEVYMYACFVRVHKNLYVCSASKERAYTFFCIKNTQCILICFACKYAYISAL